MNKGGKTMPNYIVVCPYCRTRKNASQNMEYKCSGCGARISVGNDGRIKNSKPGKQNRYLQTQDEINGFMQIGNEQFI